MIEQIRTGIAMTLVHMDKHSFMGWEPGIAASQAIGLRCECLSRLTNLLIHVLFNFSHFNLTSVLWWRNHSAVSGVPHISGLPLRLPTLRELPLGLACFTAGAPFASLLRPPVWSWRFQQLQVESVYLFWGVNLFSCDLCNGSYQWSYIITDAAATWVRSV